MEELIYIRKKHLEEQQMLFKMQKQTNNNKHDDLKTQ